jgi:hypothetical protein
MREVWIAAVAILAALGCISTTWRPMAAGSLMCPEDKIEYERTNGNVIVFGCGRTDVLTAEPEDRWSSLRARAAFEMSCSTSAIEITLLSPSLYGATGCDKKIVYKDVPRVGIRVDSNQSASTSP